MSAKHLTNARGRKLVAKNQPGYLAHVALILETHTQKEAALLLNVSDRTIRRWKNEGSIPKPERVKRINIIAREEIKIRAASKKKHIPIKLVRMTGGSYYYAVKGQTNWNMAMLLKYIHSIAPQGYPPLFRFIIRIPTGGTSPGGREYKQGGFYSTMAMSLEHATTDNDYLDYIEEYNKQNNIYEIVRMLPWQVAQHKKPVKKTAPRRKGKRK